MPRTGDERDTAQVDASATRRRLMAFVETEGYRPDLLSRIARISVQLRDPVQAGRYWLLSDATGPDVESAVEAFAESCLRSPKRMAVELRFAREWKLDALSRPARQRIEKYGLDAALAPAAHPAPARPVFTVVALAALGALIAALLLFVLLRR